MSSRPRCGSSSGCVGRHDGDPAARERGDRLGVRLGDVLDGADELEVLRADRGDETTSGRAMAQSAAICPSPRMPISVTSTSRLGLEPATVSGRPISLFWLASAQIVGRAAAQSAPRMSFVDVLPVEPTTATTRASLFERTSDASAASAASWSSRDERARAPRSSVVRDVRRRRCSARRRGHPARRRGSRP